MARQAFADHSYAREARDTNCGLVHVVKREYSGGWIRKGTMSEDAEEEEHGGTGPGLIVLVVGLPIPWFSIRSSRWRSSPVRRMWCRPRREVRPIPVKGVRPSHENRPTPGFPIFLLQGRP